MNESPKAGERWLLGGEVEVFDNDNHSVIIRRPGSGIWRIPHEFFARRLRPVTVLSYDELVTEKLVRNIQWNPNRTREILEAAFAVKAVSDLSGAAPEPQTAEKMNG